MSCTWTLSLLLSTMTAAPQQPIASPLVAAYDRFFDEPDGQSHIGGALLLSELSCTACHATEEAHLQAKRGPRLDGAGLRLQREWILRFIAAPQIVKPGTTMPKVLHLESPEETDRVSRALAAFLSNQRKPFPELVSTAGNPIAFEFWKKGNYDRGRTLYHQVGCVACHEPDADFAAGPQRTSELENLLAQLEPDEIRELGLENARRPVQSVPHGNLAAKYTRRSLTYFLLDPNETRPSGRMPSLKLKPDEAADIASYLLRGQSDDLQAMAPATDNQLIDEGRRWFVELRCANCHDVKDALAPRLAKPLSRLDVDAERACVGRVQQDLPYFATNEKQTDSLQTGLAFLIDSQLREPTALESPDFRMLQLNCYACHEREKRGGIGPRRLVYFETVGHVDLGDEGRLPPPLDGVGQKLTQTWFTRVLAGSGDLRPHMFIRMPVFSAMAVAAVPESFEKVDAASSRSDREFRSFENSGTVKELADAGRSLLDLGCVQCHPLRGEHLPGVVGVDLAEIETRVRPRWFRDFLLNPALLKSRTRMPTFFPNGRSGVPAILDGDVERQIAAMWTYLKDIDRRALPEKLATSKVHNFELVPKERPILLRTFMQGAGTHAIAVGFPAKVHLAFDAEAVRLAHAWRGRFIDAHGTWFDRFSPLAVPLGEDVVAFPPGVPLAVLVDAKESWPIESSEENAYRFRGYRLDSDGVPTFLYRFGRFEIEDRFEPTSDKQLARKLLIRERRKSADQRIVWFRANVGKSLKRISETACVNEAGLMTSVSGDMARAGVLRGGGDEVTEWIIPLDVQQTLSMEVRYQW